MMKRLSKKVKGKRKLFNIRYFVQTFFFILILGVVINHTVSLHAICPFGGVVSLYTYISSGTFVKQIHESSFTLMIIVFIMAIGFGPVFCGWICPFGTFQEGLSIIGKKIFKNGYNKFIPYKYDKYLRFFRYVSLGFVIYMTAKSAHLVFVNVDPYHALFHLWSGEFAIGGLIVLILVVIASMFIERPWCKYLCPYGALLGIFNLFRIFKIRRNKSTCVSCGLCDSVCPMNIKVSKTKVVRNHQCISCMKCTSENACPIENTVEFSSRGGASDEA